MSAYVAHVSEQILQDSPLAFPRLVWNYYVEYLYFYEPDSWVAKIASAFRILAILFALPLTILALLDISSYLIARTLGVIDDVKASTSDTSMTPSAMGIESSSTPPAPSHISTTPAPKKNESRTTFYAAEDNLKLSGVGVFSPAESRSPSPGPDFGNGCGLRQRTKQTVDGET